MSVFGLVDVACAVCVTSPLMTSDGAAFRCRTCGAFVNDATLAGAWMDAAETIGLLGESGTCRSDASDSTSSCSL